MADSANEASRDSAAILKFPEPKRTGATEEELAEYRMLLPVIRQMVKEWQTVRAMCPIARRLTEE